MPGSILCAVRRLVLALFLAVALSGVAAGCGGDDNEPSADTTASTTAAAACDKASLDVVKPGKLTVATDNPAFPPWFEGTKKDDPWDPTTTPTKKGYEAQVAYGVAKKLGFSDADVVWTVVPFNSLFRPGQKDFDFDVNQVSYSPVRAKAVGFSESYYDVEQALVSTKGSKVANAKSLADLKDAKLGAQIGTTSYDTITEVIEPGPKPQVYDTNNDAISGLKAKQIDGIVVDYPTSLYMAAVQVPNGLVVGRLPRIKGAPEHFGLVTEKGSSLIPCLNKAIASLRQDGTLEQLRKKWIVGSAPPVLQ
jgi:polar amino acid transport system substrate-binding protein